MTVNINKELPIDLQAYIDECERQLLNGEPTEFVYPDELFEKPITLIQFGSKRLLK